MKNKTQFLKILLLMSCIFVFAAGQAWAATITWNGSVDTDWNTAGNWAPAQVPTTTDDVIIPTGAVVTTSAAINAKTISINGNSTLTIGHATNIATAGIGGITLNGTSALSIGAVAVVIGNATYRGDIVMNDNSTLTTTGASNITLSGTWTKGNDATISLNAATIFSFVGPTALSLPSTVNSFATLTVNKVGSTVTLNGNMTTSANVTLTNGTIIVGDYNLSIGGTTGIAAGATLNADYTDANITRVFTGAVTINGTLNSSGPRIAAGNNNTFTAAMSIPATGVLNINNSKTTFTSTLAGAAPGAVVNALGTDLYFNGVVTFTNLTLNTNSNTDLTMNPGAAQSIPALTCKNASFTATGANITMTGNLTVYGNLIIASAGAFGLDVDTYTLTVYGDFNNSTATSVIDLTSGVLNLYGAVTDWGNSKVEFLTAAATTLNILGSGALAPFPAASAAVNLGIVTMNRTGEHFDLNSIAQATTFASLTITAGKVTFDAGVNGTVTGATTIGADGTLVTNGATLTTFTGAVTCAGTIDASDAADELLFTLAPTFTGTLKTGVGTILTFAASSTLPASVVLLEELRVLAGATVTLSSNLTLDDALDATNFPDATSIILVNGNTLTLTGGIGAAALGKINIKNSSSLISTGAADFTGMGNASLITDETSNLTLVAGATAFPTGSIKFNNLSLTTAGTLALTAGITVYGNLSVGTGATLTKGTFALTVYGDLSSTGTTTLDGAGAVSLYGQLQGIGITFDANTDLNILGTSSQLIMPTGTIAALGKLTLNRPSGMKLNGNISALGIAAANGLVITSGDLDLNGYTITLTAVNVAISETAGNTIINTGATGVANGFIQTAAAGSTPAEAIASKIGVVSLSTGGNVQVRRYPMTIPVPGIGLSTSRVYQILTSTVTVATFEFDNTELYSNASDLKLYTAASADFAFAIATDQTLADGSNRTVNENTPVGKGNLAYSSMRVSPVAAGSFYALAAAPGDGGIMYTWSGASGGNWGTEANWTPNGRPTSIDQVVIGPATVNVNGAGEIFECKTLYLSHAQSTIRPNDNGIDGDNVSIRVMGNITMVPGAEILGVNGTGRLSLIVGDGAKTGVSCAISGNSNYVSTDGIWVQDLTVNGADLTSTNRIRVSGDITLIANSAAQIANMELWGGYDSNQQITVPSSANLQMGNIRLDNNANATTSSNFTLTDRFLVKSGSSFNATGGTALFNTATASAGDPWNVESGATLKLYNVEFNSAGGQDFDPIGVVYIQGDFSQLNTDAFAPTEGKVIFSNTSEKEIVNTATAADLVFYDIEVATSARLLTSSSWQVTRMIDVKANGELKADNGNIAFVNAAPAMKYIKNASTQTLEFNDLTITNGVVYTSDSWVIKGNLTTTEGLVATNGTITFDNIQEKVIEATTAPVFFKIKISDGSKVTTGTADYFTIRNNATNPSGAGIEVEGTGAFYVGNAASVITFDADGVASAGYPKLITKSSAGRLEFGLLTIAASPMNEVTTASSFEITAAGAAAFNNAGAGGKFTATAGTITFSGAAPVIVSVSPAVTQFNSILTKGTTALTLTDAQEVYVAGDITVNNQSSIAPAGTNSKFIFNGAGAQAINGTSTAATPVAFADVVINKAAGSVLTLGINTVINSNVAHELTLTEGILSLGNKTFTNGAGIISRTNGVINGSTGTYVIATNHQTPKLEDVYFTVDGVPTLYNLTVNAAHTTANTLTVNGTLNLNTANLTIGAGTSASNPIKLICNGNLTKGAGLIDGDVDKSRLVLQGTGTVIGGLSNAFFVGTAATTCQLEVARQESLGGNLNIANTSYLRINTGINNFNLGTNTLTFNTTSFITMISGGIKAGTNSTVDLKNSITSIPGTMFIDEECYNLTIGAAINLEGSLKINGTLTGVYNITTNDNILTFGPAATLPAFTGNAHVIGNVRRTVTSTATSFPIGNGVPTSYVPLTLQFATAGSSQMVTVSRNFTDPTYNKGGNPTNSVDVLWTITPEGSSPNDRVKATFQWPAAIDGGTGALANASFPAKWNGSYWQDYRNNMSAFVVADPRVLAMSAFPISNSAALAGEWAVFNPTANTNAAKDAAIALTNNRIVILDINPDPVVLGNAFKVILELQNQYGQQVTTTNGFEYTLSKIAGAGTFANFVGVIPAGQSQVIISGLTITGTAGSNHQFKVDTTGGSTRWTPTVSKLFDVLPAAPSTQATNIIFTNIEPTGMTISWTNGNGAKRIVVMKPESLLLPSEMPVNGETYYANSILGAGSNIGDASVIYNGAGNTVNVTGLAPNTTYFIYVFEYFGVDANENYRTSAAAGNPRSQATTGTTDDDATLGSNNTRATSKTIGTNTPVKGLISSASDVDWFSFAVTSNTPNIRVMLYNLPGDYNVEIYNLDGFRKRRSIIPGTANDAFIINDLAPGTYTLKIYGYNGAFDATNPYTFKVTTKKNEIFSVTP